MAIEIIRSAFPGIAASVVPTRCVVVQATGVNRGVQPVATCNVAPFGFVGDSAATTTEAVTVYDRDNHVKAKAAGSVAVGMEVGVATTQSAGTGAQLGQVAGASGFAVFSVGQAISAANPGEYFTFVVNPRQLSGLV